jgi:hypothetical protein
MRPSGNSSASWCVNSKRPSAERENQIGPLGQKGNAVQTRAQFHIKQ